MIYFSYNSCNFKIFVSSYRVYFFIRIISYFLSYFNYFFVSCQIYICIMFVSYRRVVSKITSSICRYVSYAYLMTQKVLGSTFASALKISWSCFVLKAVRIFCDSVNLLLVDPFECNLIIKIVAFNVVVGAL